MINEAHIDSIISPIMSFFGIAIQVYLMNEMKRFRGQNNG